MSDFANLHDAGRQLGAVLAAAMSDVADPVLLACLPNGVPVALGIRESFASPVLALPVQRGGGEVVISPMPELAGRHVVVVDDGVESGSVARAAATAMVQSGVESATLAVPVCSRAALATLEHRYDRVVAVVTPLVHVGLAGHFEDFDVIDEAEARRLLAGGPA